MRFFDIFKREKTCANCGKLIVNGTGPNKALCEPCFEKYKDFFPVGK